MLVGSGDFVSNLSRVSSKYLNGGYKTLKVDVAKAIWPHHIALHTEPVGPLKSICPNMLAGISCADTAAGPHP